MGTGRGNKLVGQAGEFLVAGELARRGYISTTFTGNVPDYDIVASSDAGKHISVQVKTALSGSWHHRISCFCEISFDGSRQVMGAPKPAPVIDLVTVFVVLGERSGQDRFYVLRWDKLRDLVVADYTRWMDEREWTRPKNPQSLHTAILERQLTPYRDAWDTISDLLAGLGTLGQQAGVDLHGGIGAPQ